MDSDPENQSKYRFLCLCAADEKVAAAFYELQTSRICVLSQVPEPGLAFDVTQQILRHVDPTVTIIPSSASARFIDAVRGYTDQEEITCRTPKHLSGQIDAEKPTDEEDADADADPAGDMDHTGATQTLSQMRITPSTSDKSLRTPVRKDQLQDTPTGEDSAGGQRKKRKGRRLLTRVSVNVVSVAAKFFSVESAKNIVLDYEGFKTPANVSRSVKQSFLAGCIDFEETVTIRALAGLITYLTRSAVSQLLSLSGSLAITSFTLPDSVRISESTLKSLAVTSYSLVPRLAQTRLARKPASSLVGLFEVFCKNQLARKYVRRLLLQPIRDVVELKSRLDFVSHFMTPENECMIGPGSELSGRLARVQSLNSVFRQMRCKLVTVAEWKTFVTCLNAAKLALEVMVQLKEPNAMAQRAAELLDPEVLQLKADIDVLIDLSPTTEVERTPLNFSFHIRSGVVPELDELRSLFLQLDDMLREATRKEVEYWASKGIRVPDFKLQFMYGPGFVLALNLYTDDLPICVGMMNQREGTDQIFDARDDNGNHIFFKTSHLKQMDLSYGDDIQKIPHLETQIQLRAQEKVLEHADQIDAMIEHCATVEALLAFAQVGRQEGWVRPTFSQAKLEIRGGRHPLYEKLVGPQNFQANDFASPSGIGKGRKIAIITGPNASGKTVFLKEVGVIVLLALCGSYVPAESAVIPVVDSIFTTLKHNHSITNESSSFFGDLKNLSTMITQSTSKTLILMDEFGKGTRSQDGIALLAATIMHFLAHQTPHLLIASHFHCLSDLLRDVQRDIQYLRFTATMGSKDIFEPTFMIEEGKAGSSLASSIHAIVQLDREVVQRAAEVSRLLKQRSPLTPKYDSEQKALIEKIKFITDLFHKTNFRSRISVDDMFDAIDKLPLL